MLNSILQLHEQYKIQPDKNTMKLLYSWASLTKRSVMKHQDVLSGVIFWS